MFFSLTSRIAMTNKRSVRIRWTLCCSSTDGRFSSIAVSLIRTVLPLDIWFWSSICLSLLFFRYNVQRKSIITVVIQAEGKESSEDFYRFYSLPSNFPRAREKEESIHLHNRLDHQVEKKQIQSITKRSFVFSTDDFSEYQSNRLFTELEKKK